MWMDSKLWQVGGAEVDTFWGGLGGKEYVLGVQV